MPGAGYTYLTRDLTLNLAGLLVKQNAGMVFCYVSAVGADPSGQSRSMWARVKGRTEQELLKLPFRQAYMFRPGFVRPTPGLQRTHSYYKAISWLYPVLRPLFPKYVITLSEIGQAMIHSVTRGYGQPVLESKEIAHLAKPSSPEK
ncbi:hypothetical protein GCM10010912_11570 [Paenibacillus albidus]|uniref:Oxidoreductase n=1 Tax=Paenibacillus albidus TaxID=2041023 RepID=A0A917C307_9BACL|nr:hypothetical protein [Paenibacillus albidus]GGF68252.1 hypothetical protein GCM10010912_11570 [Paenibacillus albidus]